MDRRAFAKNLSVMIAGLAVPMASLEAKTYLTLDQAKKLLWGNEAMQPVEVTLTAGQKKTIQKASRVRVRHLQMKVWKTESGGWFILDQIIGKHENIDMAFAYDSKGAVLGMEILTYRETYGFQVQNPKWRAQFHGKDASEVLLLDEQIKNISGATLSCRHITDGVNRLSQTWEQVLRFL